MTHENVVRETFSTWEEASAARKRLAEHGFARNSIDVRHAGQEVELTIHTQPRNRERAQEVIHESSLAHHVQPSGRQLYGHAPSCGQTFLLVGALAMTCSDLVGIQL